MNGPCRRGSRFALMARLRLHECTAGRGKERVHDIVDVHPVALAGPARELGARPSSKQLIIRPAWRPAVKSYQPPHFGTVKPRFRRRRLVADDRVNLTCPPS